MEEHPGGVKRRSGCVVSARFRAVDLESLGFSTDLSELTDTDVEPTFVYIYPRPMVASKLLGRYAFGTLLLFSVASGCDAGDDGSASAGADEREPIGKADAAAGSCEDLCGADYDDAASCQCDASCSTYGDCCEDYAPLCEGEIEDPQCDPELFCAQVITCVDGQQYPTGCGPANCDAPIGPCGGGEPECDPELICGQAITCVDGQEYPTTCGPGNCDEPLGPCGGGGQYCDPELFCTQVITCVDGQEYPTGCGPANCDAPIGPC